MEFVKEKGGSDYLTLGQENVKMSFGKRSLFPYDPDSSSRNKRALKSQKGGGKGRASKGRQTGRKNPNLTSCALTKLWNKFRVLTATINESHLESQPRRLQPIHTIYEVPTQHRVTVKHMAYLCCLSCTLNCMKSTDLLGVLHFHHHCIKSRQWGLDSRGHRT